MKILFTYPVNMKSSLHNSEYDNKVLMVFIVLMISLVGLGLAFVDISSSYRKDPIEETTLSSKITV